jgi:CPA1 family monovalent cation:H+ antiporter
MELFYGFTYLIVLSAAFAYLNTRFLKLPNTIGIMLIALLASVLLIAVSYFSPGLEAKAAQMLNSVDFSKVLMEIMLSFLLFAGALHVNVNTLAKEGLPILLFATVGIVVSTFVVGTLMYVLLPFAGFEINYIYCLLFGSLISPTDPIAVLGILKKAGVPKALEVKITGESLFNDGIAVVVFLSIFRMADVGVANITAADIGILFLEEVVGGTVLGFAVGYLGYRMIRSIDNYVVEVLITLAMVLGSYVLATTLHFSGPLAVVIMGLMMSQQGRERAMSDQTRQYIDMFWEMVDEVLNAVLFVFIGLEILVVKLNFASVIIGALAIEIVLIARFMAVYIPVSILKLRRTFLPNTVGILVWGGLRGGISVALALSLKPEMFRDLFVTVTYVVVVFSIVVQGLTIEPLVKRLKMNTVSDEADN